MDSETLAKSYLAIGGAGLVCCASMHNLGTKDFRTPITIEYSRGNPLAFAFFVSALVSASLVAWLFHRGNAKCESLMYASVAFCIGLLMVTSPDAVEHILALLAAVCLASLVPVIFVLRSEFTLGSLILLAAPLSLSFAVAIASFSPGGTMGLGIAERLWFGVSYIVNATVIKMLYEDGLLPDRNAYGDDD